MKPRKMVLQLTPLLDLLLIVIFAQYMDVKQTFHRQESQLVKDKQQQQQTLDDVTLKSQLLEELSAVQERLITEQKTKLDLLEQKVVTTGQQLDKTTQQITQIAQDRTALLKFLEELYHVSGPKVEELLTQKNKSENFHQNPAINIDDLLSEAQKLSQANPDYLLKHAIEFNELRKRIDVWNLFINNNGYIEYTGPGVRKEFRALNPEDLEAKLYDLYKSLPQPKSVVIILVSYGDNPALVRDAVLKGIPKATERMRLDANGRTRFEYAVLGYRPLYKDWNNPNQKSTDFKTPVEAPN
jgi:hypothetical protein